MALVASINLLAVSLIAISLTKVWMIVGPKRGSAPREEIVIVTDGLHVGVRGADTVNGEPRRPAHALGKVGISEDFDAPLPPEIQAGFEGSG